MPTLLDAPPSREKVLDIVGKGMFGSRGPIRPEEFDTVNGVVKSIYAATKHGVQPGDPRHGDVMKAMASGGFMGEQINPTAQFGEALRAMQADLEKAGISVGKEINFTTFTDAVPSSVGFNVFDLSGPARVTAPFMAPLRERIPRTGGMGPAALFKLITGFSGSMTGGVGALNPAFSLEVPLAGSNIEAARGNAIEYAQADGITRYTFNAIRDAVTFTAFFSGEGFQDLRAMSAALGMQVSLMGEEREILMGRNTVIASVGAATGTARAVVTGGTYGTEVGITGVGGGGTNVYAKITAIGPFGETAGGTVSVAVNIAAAAIRVIDYTWTDVAGALGYNVYVAYQDAGGVAPTDYLLDYITANGSQQSTGFNQFTVGTAGRRTTTAVMPTSDTGTGSSLNYRGLVQSIEEGPIEGTSITGTSQVLNAEQSGQSMDWLQNILAGMWQTAKADPDDVIMNSREIKNASALILAGQSSNYRINIAPSEQNGIVAGVLVTSVMNESTRKMLRLVSHPWLPFGNALILSYGLPFATAFGQTNVMEMKGPQDLMQVQWPLTTLRWEWTNLWMNALVLYAPTFNAVVHGIAQEDDAATGFIC